MTSPPPPGGWKKKYSRYLYIYNPNNTWISYVVITKKCCITPLQTFVIIGCQFWLLVNANRGEMMSAIDYRLNIARSSSTYIQFKGRALKSRDYVFISRRRDATKHSYRGCIHCCCIRSNHAILLIGRTSHAIRISQPDHYKRPNGMYVTLLLHLNQSFRLLGERAICFQLMLHHNVLWNI